MEHRESPIYRGRLSAFQSPSVLGEQPEVHESSALLSELSLAYVLPEKIG